MPNAARQCDEFSSHVERPPAGPDDGPAARGGRGDPPGLAAAGDQHRGMFRGTMTMTVVYTRRDQGGA